MGVSSPDIEYSKKTTGFYFLGDGTMNDEKVFFIRHTPYKLDRTTKDLDDLKKSNQIAIFYDNAPFDRVVKNIDYSGNRIEYIEEYFSNNRNLPNYNKVYKSALNYMWFLGKNGGLVVAEYNSEGQCSIGRVLPNTKIEVFKEKFNVTLPLTKVIQIDYADYPVLPAVRPPHGTICEPHTSFFRDIIPAIFNNALSSIKIRRSLLHYKMLEQLCLEYLREKKILKYCILRPGKTVATIDIAGVSFGGKTIYAQVKADHIDETEHKEFTDFVKDKKDTINFIFCERANEIKDKSDNTNYIDVDKDVFDFFNSTDEGKKMIKRMIGFNTNEDLKM